MVHATSSVNPSKLRVNMIKKLKEKRGNSPSSVVLEAAIIIVFMFLALVVLW